MEGETERQVGQPVRHAAQHQGQQANEQRSKEPLAFVTISAFFRLAARQHARDQRKEKAEERAADDHAPENEHQVGGQLFGQGQPKSVLPGLSRGEPGVAGDARGKAQQRSAWVGLDHPAQRGLVGGRMKDEGAPDDQAKQVDQIRQPDQ